MEYNGKEPSCELEKQLFEQVKAKTPDYIKNNKLIDIDDNDEITFVLKKEHLAVYHPENNPEGLGLSEWFQNYEKEAMVSTAGIRGPQNILWPQDTRFPINIIGIMLATHAKGLVALEKYPDANIQKIAASEVRYNSDKYLSIITRIQAALGITTHIPVEHKTIPIWLASFLAFKLDLLGGEYITSSHGISVKNATKDLNDQGSQYLPEESMEFVNKIKEIFEITCKNGSYSIKLAPSNHSKITEELMNRINNGVDLYVDYLKNGVATVKNLSIIKNAKNKIFIENVGGCAYQTLSKVLDQLDISEIFEWLNIEETPFFHSIGKSDTDPKGNKAFYDWSVDAAVMLKDKNGNVSMPVIETLDYGKKLCDKPVGTVILITDPDHDRLNLTQIETVDKIPLLKKLGIDYVKLENNRILTVYTPNQGFLMIMDFWTKQLQENEIWKNHPRFIIKTTASAMSWDEWANKNLVNIVNVPVGFKEIANIMKKVEKQIKENPTKEVVVKDVFGKKINLGVQPRLLFGGEESGGMIIGPENPITSLSGRLAIAMREKSATEAIIITSAMVATLENKNMFLSNNLEKVFETNKIIGKFDVREDIAYYNESEPDIEKLKIAKKEGEALRTQNDLFYLSMAIAKNDNILSVEQVQQILFDAFPNLNFENLKAIKFVGDGTFLEFDDKYIEIRPSGTDAKTKAYGAGSCKEEILKYAQTLGNYSGKRTELHKKYISEEYYNNSKQHSLDVYQKWANEDANNELFCIPDYSKTLCK
jgi:phosphomannomutase